MWRWCFWTCYRSLVSNRLCYLYYKIYKYKIWSEIQTMDHWPSTVGGFDQLRHAERHGAHEVVPGGSVPIPNLDGQAAVLIWCFQLTEEQHKGKQEPRLTTEELIPFPSRAVAELLSKITFLPNVNMHKGSWGHRLTRWRTRSSRGWGRSGWSWSSVWSHSLGQGWAWV